jgi:hypothetical protein
MTEDYKLDFSLEKLLEDLEKDPQIEFCNYMFDYSCERIADARKEKNMKKTDRESWKMVWEELQKQF